MTRANGPSLTVTGTPGLAARLAGVDVAIVERRISQELIGTRAGGLHARTLEVLDQRGIVDRFVAEGEIAQLAGFAWNRLDISDFPSRHPYGLVLWQERIERILARLGRGTVRAGLPRP